MNTSYHLPMKMEQLECSETSAYKIQTPGNYPKENIQESNSLKYKTWRCFSVRFSRWSEGFEASPARPSDSTSMKTKISTQHWCYENDMGQKREQSEGNTSHCHLYPPQIQRGLSSAPNIPEDCNTAVRTSNIAKYTLSLSMFALRINDN
jgi:hypothetical protein